jgi:hypothetical protein
LELGGERDRQVARGFALEGTVWMGVTAMLTVFIPFFPFFPLHVFALCLLLYFGGSLTIFYVSYKK